MTSSQQLSLLPDRVFLTYDPQVTVARPCLGLVLYIDDPLEWAVDHASRLCQRFVDLVGEDRIHWFMTSALDRWRSVKPEALALLIEQLRVGALSARARHLLLFRLVDDAGAPTVEFSYREVDPGRSRRLGYLRLTLPRDHPSDDLLELAIEVAQTAPFWTGVGGAMVSVNPLFPRESFEWALRWARRCVGLHVSSPDDYSRAVLGGLPGVSWLNLFGARAIGELGIDVDGLEGRAWASEVGLMRLAKGALLRAGEAPELGDVNALEHPSAIAEVAGALGPYLMKDPPPLPGPFGERTADWIKRFSFPEAWK